MMDINKDAYLTDFNTIDQSQAVMVAESDGCYVMCEDQGEGLPDYPIGVLWFANLVPGISVEIHFLCRPGHLRKIIKANAITEGIDLAFQDFKVRKIKAIALDNQAIPIKLLLKHGFSEHGHLPYETKQAGKWRSALILECDKDQWRYFKKHPERFKHKTYTPKKRRTVDK
jgi:RimJ/RimL family protein N-acetyltransferase